MLLYVSMALLLAAAQGASNNHHPATTTTAVPDAVRLQKLEQVTEQLTRQLMLQQLYVEEKTRSEYDSGIKQVRMRMDGFKTYDVDSFGGRSVVAVHDHSNLERTPGLGELIAILNGLEFRTRHNDYKVKMPVHNKTYHLLEDVPFPPVPPSVTNKHTMAEQAAELREYFKAWKDQDHHHRDYRPYFKPVLCVLEGAWTLDDHIDEPFSSDRHAIEADSWFDLQEKIHYTSLTGDRINSQNFAYLPTTIYNVSNGMPQFAQWNYRIMCHPLKTQVNISNLTPLESLGHRMAAKRDFNQYLNTRMVRYMVDEKTTDHRYQWNLLDDLMYEVPGKDNYGAHIVDSAFGLPKLKVLEEVPINVAYYHRRWKVGEHDAMGDTVGHRGFADRNMYVAENTQPRIAPVKVTHCHGPRRTRVCETYVKRLSYAIPLELIFLTPLHLWNPYNIKYHGKHNTHEAAVVAADGRNGGVSSEKAYNGTHSKAYYFTPVEFFSGQEVSHDPADTTKSATGVLDRQGNLRSMKSSGIRTLLPNIADVGVLRTRYPIMPVSVEGSPTWKEMEALRDVVMDMDGNKRYIYNAPDGLVSYSASPSHHNG